MALKCWFNAGREFDDGCNCFGLIHLLWWPTHTGIRAESEVQETATQSQNSKVEAILCCYLHVKQLEINLHCVWCWYLVLIFISYDYHFNLHYGLRWKSRGRQLFFIPLCVSEGVWGGVGADDGAAVSVLVIFCVVVAMLNCCCLCAYTLCLHHWPNEFPICTRKLTSAWLDHFPSAIIMHPHKVS